MTQKKACATGTKVFFGKTMIQCRHIMKEKQFEIAIFIP
jgi:hypothetical protein